MAIARVSGQSNATNASGVASYTIALTNNPTTGNHVIVGVTTDSGTTVSTVRDGAGSPNSYTKTTTSPAVSGTNRVYNWYLNNAPATANKTITVTISAAGAASSAWIQEYSGVTTTSPLEATEATHTSATSSTNINDPTITTTNDGDLIFVTCLAGQTISTANSPFTGVSTVQNGNYAEDLIQGTHGGQAIAFTQSPAGTWVAIASAFIAAAGGAGAPAAVNLRSLMGVGT